MHETYILYLGERGHEEGVVGREPRPAAPQILHKNQSAPRQNVTSRELPRYRNRTRADRRGGVAVQKQLQALEATAYGNHRWKHNQSSNTPYTIRSS